MESEEQTKIVGCAASCYNEWVNFRNVEET